VDTDSLRVFLKVAELSSLTGAGKQLGMGKSRVSRTIGALERELGGTLFHRTTRAVRLTAGGTALLPRARRIVRDAEEIDTLFRTGQRLRGTVRLDLPVRFARNVILPRLPELLERHPELELFVSTTDRIVDPVREGFDCVLRVGQSRDSELVQRKLGEVAVVNCASRLYVERRGMPRGLEDLEDHVIIRYDSALSPESPALEYVDGGESKTWPMACSVTVNGSDAYAAACRAGLGIVQVPLLGVRDELASGELVEVLPDHRCAPMPVVLLHTHGRNAPHRVRAVTRWIADVITPHLD
jgi:DNA-binding transcriptional LysR family regulator